MVLLLISLSLSLKGGGEFRIYSSAIVSKQASMDSLISGQKSNGKVVVGKIKTRRILFGIATQLYWDLYIREKDEEGIRDLYQLIISRLTKEETLKLKEYSENMQRIHKDLGY